MSRKHKRRTAVPSVEKRVYNENRKTENIESYDIDNLYPQRMIDIINASGTAKRSVETYAKYIHAGGFKDETFYKSVINKKGLTADKLLRLVAHDYACLGGRSYHVNYNGLLKISQVNHVPFEYCRIGTEKKKGMVAVYEDWECKNNTKVDVDKIKWYPRFTTDTVVLLSQIQACGGLANFEGAIYTDEKYPLAPIDPVIEDVISDKSIKTFTDKELQNGFRPSAIVEYPKEFESDEAFDEECEKWTQFQGPETTNKIIVLENSGQERITVSKFDQANNDKMYESTNKRVKDSIIQRFGQPPSLLGRRDQNAVFSSQNIEDDTKFYNSITTDERLMFEEDFKLIFSNFYIPICPSGDYSILELQFNAISTEKPSKISQLGVGGITAMTGVMTNPDLSNEQKINMLVLAFGYTLQEAQSQVLGTRIPE